MMKLIGILFLVPHLSWALPKKVEVWFVSTPKVSQLIHSDFKVAQVALQCQPMGDYCFDPQVGLYKKGSEKNVQAIDGGNAIIENKADYDFVEPATSLDRKLIECDKKQMFDIFCGKSKASQSNVQTPLEIWVDVSSTMKQVDVVSSGSQCVRESFVRLLNQSCPLNEKMKVYTFEEYRKEVGSFERVCQSDGLNNMDRIIDDIKKSKAKTVIIITDIFEVTEKFINQIELTGVASVKGVDKSFYAADIKAQLKRVRKYCL